MQHVRDLIVWQRAIELVAEIYARSATMPSSERFGLTSQMQRAAVSIASNIAEGHERRSRRDFRRFVVIACGSAAELETHLTICTRLKFLDTTETRTASLLLDEVGRMLRAMEKSLASPVTKRPHHDATIPS